MGLGYCTLIMYYELDRFQVLTALSTPTTLNKTCVDDIGVLLQFDVYKESCLEADPHILSWVESAISEEPRTAASTLHLPFHDCFVNASQSLIL
ncbi:hypothetical protein NC652_025931 [Populus alba x Populus x berolinensis]|nr:hypothetical protein NC652_025931 [Populus alba x Populus x berolinensis]